MMKLLKIKVNAQIAASQVRVIAEDGSDMGVYSLTKACDFARTGGHDLVHRLHTKADGTQTI